MSKKIWGLVILMLFLGGLGYLWIVEIQPEIQRIKNLQEERYGGPSYQERLNERYSTVEDCKDVSGSSLPEVRERCLEVFKFSNSRQNP